MWVKGTYVHFWWEHKLLHLLWKIVWKFFRKLKIELPYDPGIPLLGIYPKEIKSLPQRGIFTLLFIVALFTIAKIWKQSVDRWIGKKTVVYICTVEYYSAIKKKKSCHFLQDGWTQKDYAKEVSQREKGKYCFDVTYMWKLKKLNLEPENKMVITRGWGVGKMKRGWSKRTKFQL